MSSKAIKNIYTVSFTLCSLMFLILLVGQLPGYLYSDSIYLMDRVKSGSDYINYSRLYFLIARLINKLDPTFILMGVFQISLFLTFLYKLAKLLNLNTVNKLAPTIPLLLLILSPITYKSVITYTRDSFYSICFMVFMLFVYKLIITEKIKNYKYVFIFGLFTSLICELRMESAIMVPLILLYLMLYKVQIKPKLIILTTFTFGFALYQLLILSTFDFKVRGRWYWPIAFSNSITQTIKNTDVPLNKNEHLIISKIFNIDQIDETHEKYGSVLTNEYINKKNSKKEKNDFLMLMPSFIFKNFKFFWTNRLDMFLKANGLSERAFYVRNHLAFTNKDLDRINKKYLTAINKYEIYRIIISNKLTKTIDSFYNKFHSSKLSKPLHYLFRSTLLGLVFSLLALLVFRFTPISSFIAILVLSKTLMIFLFTPFPRFQYSYPLYFIGFILPIMMYCEYNKKSSVTTNRP